MIKTNILKQEEEFLKQNAEIDSKTKDLLSEVNQIKEIQSKNDKFFTEWGKTDIKELNEIPIQENDKEKTELSVCSEENNGVIKYLSKVKDDKSSDFASIENDSSKDSSLLHLNKNFRRNLKLSQSAKTSASVIGAMGQGSELSLGISRHKSDIKLKLENEVIPETLKGVGHNGITRFLTAKVKLLTEQLEIMQKDEKQHLEKIKELQMYKDKSTEEKDKLIQQVNMTRSILVKCEQQTNNVSIQLQTTQAENGHLKKELETLKKELRECNKNLSTNEIKLNRTLEEAEKLKATLHQMKLEEKELRETHRKKTEELTTTIKKLDRQRNDLLNGFKKQLLLIDNLRRQKRLIEASKLLKITEEDFINFLDCNPPDFINQRDLKSSKS